MKKLKNYFKQFKNKQIIKEIILASKMNNNNVLYSFMDSVTLLHGNMLDPTDFNALSNTFMQKHNESDIKSVQSFLKKVKGHLFYPDNDQNYEPIGCVKTLTGSSQTRTITDGDYVFKYRDLDLNGLVNEIIYGGYLTYLKPELFCGVIQFNFDLNCKVIPNDGYVDAFEVYQLQLGVCSTLHICKNIVNILREMHNLGFLHNDIKLENILVDINGSYRVKFIDFESVSLVKPFVLNKQFCGTFVYCCPLLFLQDEFLRIEKTIWTDLYALCHAILILMYNVCVGSLDYNEKFNDFVIMNEHRQRVNYVRSLRHLGSVKQMFIDIFEMDLQKLKFKYGNSEFFLERLLDQIQ
jgi:serine/threonine protein kinase